MTAGNIQRVERMNYAIGGVLVIGAAITQPRPIALGIAVGVALTCLNFFFLRRLVHRWTRDAARGTSGGAGAALIFPKMIALMVAVVLSLAFLPINPVAFAIGYSVFVVSIFIEAALGLIFEKPDDDELTHG